jgi:transcriptional regulator with XRE-family HTH domain
MRLFQQERLISEITELMCRTMKDQEITRSQLAEHLHKTKGRISQILNSGTNLTLRTVADIFTLLGKTLVVSAADLFVVRPVAPNSPVLSETQTWSSPETKWNVSESILPEHSGNKTLATAT